MFKLSVTGKGSRVGFDNTKFSKTALETADIQARQAVRTFLREALNNIPTYTGTARGTFKPLGRLLRVAVPLMGPMGQPGNPDRAKKKKFIYYKGRTYKAGFEAGADYAEYAITVNRTEDRVIAHFEMTQNLPYVLSNDLNPGPPGVITAPWHWIERAREASLQYLKEVVPAHFAKMYKLSITRKPFTIKGEM